MGNWRQNLGRLLWPDDGCPCCGASMPNAAEDLLCAACADKLTSLICCPNCLAYMPSPNWPQHTCHHYGQGEWPQQMLSCVPYADKTRYRLRLLKYHNNLRLAQPFGRLLAARWRQFAAENNVQADVIVPIPLHIERRRIRGYNQSELLAKALGRQLSLPVCAGAVCRVDDTRPQHRLTPAEREANLQGAFASGAAADKVRGKKVILVDDIITSGATMREAAAVLREQGAASVWALAVASHLQK
ncbi:MAG: ComF family protein [Firmicutes bacterium]|nr:ComF family protein [Bacillota bacterium]